MDREKKIESFWRVGFDGDRAIYREDVGWSDTLKRDAQSDYPETIFRYVVEIVGNNILFYWLKDRNFYVIETEKTPIEVRRISSNANWDGKYEYEKAGEGGRPTTSSAGELLATFEEPTLIWEELTIDTVRIGDVLENSVIVELD